MSVEGWLVLVVCSAFCLTDLLWRRIPDLLLAFLLGFLLAAWWAGSVRYSWAAAVLGGLVTLLADARGGDVKGVAAVAGLLGVKATLLACALGFGLAAVVIFGYSRGWWRWPGDWPGFPLFATPACALTLYTLVG